MKLIIASVDSIFKKGTAHYFDGIKDALEIFEKHQDGNKVVIISINKNLLDQLPNDFQKQRVRSTLRRRGELINIIVENTDFNFKDIFILGAKTTDMQLAANAKLVLLTADYAKENNPNDRIYTEGYGIGILNPKRLINFTTNYLDIDKPWFYSLKINANTSLYGLTDAMTNKQPDAEVKVICEELRTFLKQHNIKNKSPFFIYALLSIYQLYKEMEDVKYWGYYPSSKTVPNQDLFELKEILRKSFKSSINQHDILIRHKNSIERKKMSVADRISDGCDSQFDSIHVNPWFEGKIEGTHVCIIDDFTNHGTSCETTRFLLEKAGVSRITFITLGKFRYDYKVYDYDIKGNVYKPNGYTFLRKSEPKTIKGLANNKSSNELLKALKDLIN